MARKHRIVAPGIPLHVIHRGNNRRRLASHASDYWRLLSMIGDASRRLDCPVHALALMSNHLHLVVTPTSTLQIAAFVKRFAQRYAAYRNRRREATGKLFEQRYRSFPLDSDERLAVATAYVDLNPVRAGKVARPEAYRWSTAHLHLGGPRAVEWDPRLWTPSSWYLRLGADATTRAARYREWLAASTRGEPSYADEIRAIEELSSLHYGRRLQRPDGSMACDVAADYGGENTSWARTEVVAEGCVGGE